MNLMSLASLAQLVILRNSRGLRNLTGGEKRAAQEEAPFVRSASQIQESVRFSPQLYFHSDFLSDFRSEFLHLQFL